MDDLEKIFKCSRCGFCCQGETTVSLDDDDRRRMVDALCASEEEVRERYWKVTGNIVQMKTVDGHCIFYENGCTVHGGRPWRCAQWPLVPAILGDEANFLTIRESCPGINKTISYKQFCRILKCYLEENERVHC